MKVLLKSRVQEFFDINGMDVLSVNSIPTLSVIDGKEYVSEESATYYIYNSHFSALYKDLLSFATSIEISDTHTTI